MRPDVQNIVALRLGGIGDVALVTPALRAIRTAWPRAHVTLVAEGPAVEIVTKSGWVDEVIVETDLYRCQSIVGWLAPRRLAALWRVARRLRQRRYDIFFSFHNLYNWTSVAKPAVVGLLSGAPVRMGLNTYGRGRWFLTHLVTDYRFEMKGQVDRFLDVCRAAGVAPDGVHTEIGLTQQDVDAADGVLKHLHLEGKRIVVIHPGAGSRVREWMPERFAEVGRRLSQLPDTAVLVTSVPGQEYLTKAVADGIPDAVVLLPMKIRELGAIIKRAALLISPDTGPMHLGLAVSTPTVGIFTAGDYQTYGQYPDDIPHVFVRHHMPCWPCRNPWCVGRRCAGAVTVDEVFHAALQLLGEEALSVPQAAPVSVRQAAPEDLPALALMHVSATRQGLRTNPLPHRARFYLDKVSFFREAEPQGMMVAEMDGEIVGAIVVTTNPASLRRSMWKLGHAWAVLRHSPEGALLFSVRKLARAAASVVSPPRALPDAKIWVLIVVEEFRRRGVARALLTAAEAHVRMQGHTEIGVTCQEHNLPAIEMYMTSGYAVRGLCRESVGRSLILVKTLSP